MVRFVEVAEKAIEFYGEKLQQVVAIEEMAELQKELSKAIRNGGAGNREAIAEEVTDVHFMLVQIEKIYGINTAEIALRIEEKAERLLARIEAEKRNRPEG